MVQLAIVGDILTVAICLKTTYERLIY